MAGTWTRWLHQPSLLLLTGLLVLLSMGVYEYAIRSPGANECAMTFMWQYPEFTRISLPTSVKRRFPSYNLFAYGEGGHAVAQSAGRFDGHPVLFVPGNAGSYRQVRSVASVAHQVFQQGIKSFRFDFFALDFDDQKAGIFGPVLGHQVAFTGQAIRAIQQLYRENGRPDVSCILLGHSIGGAVARALLVDPSFKPACIRLLLTLAAPMTQPVVRFDDAISQFYHEANLRWQQERSKGNGSAIGHIMHVALAGGMNDALVRSQLTSLPSDPANSGGNEGMDVSMVTTGIDDVWLPMDHLCIVWCKQLMIKLTRLLYDLVDSGTDRDRRQEVVHYHLRRRNRGKFFPEYLIPHRISFPAAAAASPASWIHAGDRVVRYSSAGKLLSPVYLLIPLVPGTEICVSLTGEHRHDWIAVCNASNVSDDDDASNQSIHCDSGINLSPETRLLPNRLDLPPRAVFQAPVDSLPGSHLVVSLTPQIESPSDKSFQSISLVAERYDPSSRISQVHVPSVLSSLLTMAFWNRRRLLEVPISREAAFFNVSLVGLSQAWHAYQVHVKTGPCYAAKVDPRPSIVRFHVPWNSEDSYHRILNKKDALTAFPILLNVPQPGSDDGRRSPSLQFYLDPDCGYSVTLSFSLPAMMGQVLRFHYHLLIPFLAAILVSAAGIQLMLATSRSLVQPIDGSSDTEEGEEQVRLTSAFSAMDGAGDCSVYHTESLERVLRRRMVGVLAYGLVPAMPWIALTFVTKVLPERLHASSAFSLITSLHQEHLSDTQFLLLSCLLCSLSYAAAYALALAMDTLLVGVSGGLHTVQGMWRSANAPAAASSIPGSKDQSRGSAAPLSPLPFLLSLSLILVSVCSRSAVGFASAHLTHLMFLLAVDVRDRQRSQRSGLSARSTVSRIHVTLSLLILLINLATGPALLFWISQSCPLFQSLPSAFTGAASSTTTTPGQAFEDPHLVSCMLLITGLSVVWQGSRCSGRDRPSHTLHLVVRVIGLLISATGHNLALLPALVTSVTACITLNSGLALWHAITSTGTTTQQHKHLHLE